MSSNGDRKLRGEYGRGDMVGLVDVITGVRQKKQYLSVRDSEVCVMPGLEDLSTILSTQGILVI